MTFNGLRLSKKIGKIWSRSRSNMEIVFFLPSIRKGQRSGQGHQGQNKRSNIKVMGQGHYLEVIGQGYEGQDESRSKLLHGVISPPPLHSLAGGWTRGRFHFMWNYQGVYTLSDSKWIFTLIIFYSPSHFTSLPSCYAEYLWILCTTLTCDC